MALKSDRLFFFSPEHGLLSVPKANADKLRGILPNAKPIPNPKPDETLIRTRDGKIGTVPTVNLEKIKQVDPSIQEIDLSKDREQNQVTVKADPAGTAPAATDATKPDPFAQPFYEHPDVVKQIADAWKRQANGLSKSETSFVVHGRTADATPVIRPIPDTHDYSKETFNLMPGDKAIFHTHPNLADPRPSEADMKIANKYGVDVFTITRNGLYRYAPGMKNSELVISGTDFMNKTVAAK